MSNIRFDNNMRWSQWDVWIISDIINKIPDVFVSYADYSINGNGRCTSYTDEYTTFRYIASVTDIHNGYVIHIEYPEFVVSHNIPKGSLPNMTDGVKEAIASRITQSIMSHLDAIKSNGIIYRWKFSCGTTLDISPLDSIHSGEIWGYPTHQTEKKFIANKKAERLLLSCLSKKQKNEYNEYSYFTVKGNITGKNYRIHPYKQINIEEIDTKGRVVASLCVVSNEYVPIEDHMLSQKLLIETNEELFLQTAIRW